MIRFFSIFLEKDFWDEILQTLTRNKTRSLLTAFGIFWGVFMLLLLMGGGKGLQNELKSIFSGFASNSAFVLSMKTSEPYKGFQKGRSWRLDTEDVTIIKNCVPEVDVITPVLLSRGNNKAVFEDKSQSVSMKGIYTEYDIIDNLHVREGRMLNPSDLAQRRKVCVIGTRIKEELFGDSISPCGKYLQINGSSFQIVGVSYRENNGINVGSNPATTVSVPFTTMQRLYNRGKRADFLCYTVHDNYRVSEVQDKIERLIKRAHTLHPNDKLAVMSINAEEIFNVVDSLFKGISILVWMIGIGTLLGGAIGVSNIMLVTIRERTTEIGIRRAIGAKPRDVMLQVLSETMLLTLLAGMSGITLAVGILHLIEQSELEENPDAHFQITFGLAIGAALMLSLLGILAGLAPAYRALMIKPVDAMRDE